MTLQQTINQDLKQALKNKDAEKLPVLRMLSASIKNAEIELKKRDKGLKDDEVIEVVLRQVKQHKDSAEQFKQAGRDDLAKKENSELKILQEYLPKQLSDEEIRKVVKKVIDKVGENFGAVMGKTMQELKGKADGNIVRAIVEKELK